MSVSGVQLFGENYRFKQAAAFFFFTLEWLECNRTVQDSIPDLRGQKTGKK